MPTIMSRSRRRNLLLVTLPLGGIAAFVGAVYFIDWLSAMPAGRSATYVGRQKCAECHEEEMNLWQGSDHDLAMDHATPQTVLGDFNDTQFTHIAFDDLVKLTDDELALVVRVVPRAIWAVALTDAQPALRSAVLGHFDEEERGEVLAELTWLEGKRAGGFSASSESTEDESSPDLSEFFAEGHKVIRPCDVADAQQAIGDAARQLAREGQISLDFAVTSKMTREEDQFFITTDNKLGELEKFPSQVRVWCPAASAVSCRVS